MLSTCVRQFACLLSRKYTTCTIYLFGKRSLCDCVIRLLQAAEFKKAVGCDGRAEGEFLVEFVNHADEIKVSDDKLTDVGLLKNGVGQDKIDVLFKNELQTFKEDIHRIIKEEFSDIIKTETKKEIKNVSNVLKMYYDTA